MNNDNKQHLEHLRHSAAHLLAAAALELWPGTKNAIGPSIENGFYQDFDFGNVKISDTDLEKIEKKMHGLVQGWGTFQKREVSADLARKDFAHNPYKLELIEEFAKEGKKITENDPGNFLDLCKGGHVENPKDELKYFKLLSIAGAYWRGSEKNKMLTRIYGTCFSTKEELDKYLWQLNEAKKRDHRKLGKELDLFLVSDQVGSGLPIFTPKGTVIRSVIEDYLTETKRQNGYQFVWTPHIAKSQIYQTSGHWGKYDAMFNPMKLDEEEYTLKPMNCPHHFQVYMNKPKSYKDLPFRIAENGTVYRNEKSGELGGLLRVRSLTIDDTHTFIRVSQTTEELERVLTLVKKVLGVFGFSQYKARISVSDPATPEKYLGNKDAWKKAEATLKETGEKLFDEVSVGVGEAAFYGPKIDVMVKDTLGREWQLSTVQLDYNQPKNFNMTYINEEGKEEFPAILHIAMVGSIERFMGILIEHYAGKFPIWLSPVQIVLIPIADRHREKAASMIRIIEAKGIRAELDDRQETMQAKIRNHTLQRVPYMGIIGDKEIENADAISIRTRDGKDLGKITVSEFIKQIQEEIDKKT